MSAQDRDILPQDIKPLHYSLDIFNIDTINFTYSGTVVIHVAVNNETDSISLNAKALGNLEATVSPGDLKAEVEDSSIDKERERVTFRFNKPIHDGAQITIKFSGTLNNQLAGFYRSEYKVEGAGQSTQMFSTHFEPCDARQAFPCFDEPSLKATFDFSITVPPAWTAISNMPVVSETAKGDYKCVKFATTPKISTYLLAWACGVFEYVEEPTKRAYNGVPVLVRVYTTKGLKEKGQFAVEIAAKILDYYSEVFDIDFPLPKVDLLAVHDFPIGAMENWGLLTFKTTGILYEEGKSDPRYKNMVAYLVAHELAHQWFGNLVTMSWWNDLWLKEGFATWAGWFVVDHFYPDWDVWGQFVADSMQRGFELDSLRSSHPIEVPVRNALEVDQIFDAISYLKGSSVIRMLSSALGSETFLKGVSNYLKKHSYANAQTKDLWDALSDASGRDVKAFMDPWITKTGFPVLNAKETSGALTLSQKRFLSAGDVQPNEDETIWWIPLGLMQESPAENSQSDASAAFNEKETSLSGVNTDHYKLNIGQQGFFRVNYTAERFAKLGSSAAGLSVADRIGLVTDAQALALSGDASTGSLLSLLERMKGEDNFLVWQTISTALSALRRVFGSDGEVKEGLKKFALALYSPAAEKLGWEVPEGEGYLTTRLRGLLIGAAGNAGNQAIITESKRQFDAYFAGDASAIDPSLKPRVFDIGVGEGGEAQYNSVWGEYLKAGDQSDKETALQSLGSAKETGLIKDFLEKLLGDQIPLGMSHIVPWSISNNGDAGPLLWEFVKERWDDIWKLLSGNMRLLSRFVNYALGKFADEGTLEEIKSFFESKDLKGYERAVHTAIDTVGASVHWKERDEKVVKEWLVSKGYIG